MSKCGDPEILLPSIWGVHTYYGSLGLRKAANVPTLSVEWEMETTLIEMVAKEMETMHIDTWHPTNLQLLITLINANVNSHPLNC